MNIDIPQDHVRHLLALTPAQQRKWLKNCRPEDLLMLDAAFQAWAEAGQIVPSAEGWRVWLMMAGRGYGKTRAGAEWIFQLAMMGDKRIALVGATIDEARGIMVEGVSGLLGIARRRRVKVKWEPALKRLTWPRGSQAHLFSGESPEGLRGPEHDFAWCPGARRPAARGIGRGGARRGASREPGAGCFLSRCRNGGERRVHRARRRTRGGSAGGWRFVTPVEGMRLTDRTSGVELAFRGGAWTSGALRASELLIGGNKVVGARGAAIPDVAGGTTIDVQARTAIMQLLGALRTHGLVAP